MTEPIVIRSLQKSFTVEGRIHEVLKDLDLTIPGEEITVLLGQSGCGKTTLLRLISGLDREYSGRIHVPHHIKTAFVFQEARLMPWLTVRKNITFGLQRKQTDPKEIDELISTVGLDGFADALPSQLSGGMSQRTALARALATHPGFLLMDEPFAALDFFTREKMQQVLLRIHRKTECGVLFVTHSIDEALALGDRIVVLEDKKVKKVYPFSKEERELRTPEQTLSLKEDILQNIQISGNEEKTNEV